MTSVATINYGVTACGVQPNRPFYSKCEKNIFSGTTPSPFIVSQNQTCGKCLALKPNATFDVIFLKTKGIFLYGMTHEPNKDYSHPTLPLSSSRIKCHLSVQTITICIEPSRVGGESDSFSR